MGGGGGWPVVVVVVFNVVRVELARKDEDDLVFEWWMCRGWW
jgi:hypothetical protein